MNRGLVRASGGESTQTKVKRTKETSWEAIDIIQMAVTAKMVAAEIKKWNKFEKVLWNGFDSNQ